MRSAYITYLLVPMFLGCATHALEIAPAKTPPPAGKPVAVAEPKKAAVKTGISIPGEMLVRTPSLEATWQNYKGRLVLYSVVERRDDNPLLIGQEAFTILFKDGTLLHSSQMRAGSTSTSSLKPQPKAHSEGERAGGRQMAVVLNDEGSSITAKWVLTQRNGSDYLRQTISLTSEKEQEIAEIRFLTLQTENAKQAKTAGGVAVVTESLFFGIEDADASVSIVGAKVRAMIARSIRTCSTQSVNFATVIGGAKAGEAEAAFAAALKNEEKVMPAVVGKQKKKEVSKEQPKPAPVTVKDPAPAPVAQGTQETKTVSPTKEPAKEPSKTPMLLDPNALVPAGTSYRSAVEEKKTASTDSAAKAAAAKKKADEDAAAAKAKMDAAKKKADADAAAAKAKADEQAKAEAAKKKAASDAAAAKVKADAEKAKMQTNKPAVAQPKPAAKKPAYKFPENLNPNAVLPAN